MLNHSHVQWSCCSAVLTGAFVTALEYATGVNATVIGKPEKAFFHEALKLVEVAPDRTVMIGDVCVTLCFTNLCTFCIQCVIVDNTAHGHDSKT